MQQEDSMTDISDVCAWMSARCNLAEVDPAIAAAELQRLHMLQARAPLTSCGQMQGFWPPGAPAPSTKWAPPVANGCVAQCGQCGECYGASLPEQQSMDQWHWMHSVDRSTYDEEYERYLRNRLDSEAREAIYHATLAPLLQGARASPYSQGAPQAGAMPATAVEEDSEMMM